LARIWVIHGPNLNLLGRREPELYGHMPLEEIDRHLESMALQAGHTLVSQQSNHEGELVTWIQQAGQGADLLLLNPGAYTHTSVAIRDALVAAGVLTVEVHLTNPYRRESFRRRSLIADVVQARVMGFGPASYDLALRGGLDLLAQQREPQGAAGSSTG
jgi:3-dehydroquinate dehydratase II